MTGCRSGDFKSELENNSRCRGKLSTTILSMSLERSFYDPEQESGCRPTQIARSPPKDAPAFLSRAKLAAGVSGARK